MERERERVAGKSLQRGSCVDARRELMFKDLVFGGGGAGFHAGTQRGPGGIQQGGAKRQSGLLFIPGAKCQAGRYQRLENRSRQQRQEKNDHQERKPAFLGW